VLFIHYVFLQRGSCANFIAGYARLLLYKPIAIACAECEHTIHSSLWSQYISLTLSTALHTLYCIAAEPASSAAAAAVEDELSVFDLEPSADQRLPHESIQLSGEPVPAVIGVHQMWTHRRHRRSVVITNLIFKLVAASCALAAVSAGVEVCYEHWHCAYS
jgi:hypothetical protein